MTAQNTAWVERLAELAEEDSVADYLASRPALHKAAVVERLTQEVLTYARTDLGAARRLAEAAVWVAETIGDDRSLASSQRAMANMRYLSGDYREALERYDAAAGLFRKLDEHAELAVTLSSSIQTRSYLGLYDQAFAAAREGRRLAQELGNELQAARIDSNEANVLFRQDRAVEALDLYRGALEVFRREGNAQDVAAVLFNLASCEVAVSNFSSALEAYEELKAHCEAEELPLVAIQADYNIAYLYYLRGQYQRAIELYRKARSACEAVEDRYHLALCDLDEAELYLELGLSREGSRLAEQARVAFGELGMVYEEAKAVAFLAVGLSQQEKAFRALELFGQARELFLREGNATWVGMIDFYRALILLREGRPFEARRAAVEACSFFEESSDCARGVLCCLSIARAHLRANEPTQAIASCRKALETVAKLDSPSLRYKAYFVAGEVAEARGDAPGALRAYRMALEALEDPRTQLRDERLKVTFLSDKQRLFEQLVVASLAPGGKADPEQLFGWVEQSKVQRIADLIAFRAHTLPAKASTRSDLVERMRRLREELNWYDRQLDVRHLHPRGTGSSVDSDELTRQSRRYEQELVRTLGELHSGDPELEALQAAIPRPLSEIREALPEETTLVEYFVAGDRVYACVVDRQEVSFTPLTAASRMHNALRSLRLHLLKVHQGVPQAAAGRLMHREAEDALRALDGELVEPICDRLTTRRLILVPHDQLHAVALAGLLDAQGRPLGQRYDLTLAPTAGVLSLPADSPADGWTAPKAMAPAGEAQWLLNLLPEAELLPEALETRAGLSGAASGARWLHLAAGGFESRDNPMFSSLDLGQLRLSIADLFQLDLRCRLLVLTGCGGPLDREWTGDERLSLMRGLLFAGADQVLLPLWNAAAESRALFLECFYAACSRGETPAAASGEALGAVRKRFPHPYHWAGYSLASRV